ncbi:MAG: redox-regulated ATPase YchF [Bacteroidales bacterium]|nr:redox-regulated ATPase YchF [Bacteroidales bacterium]
MALKCGIIGITNIGKTTIFNCISKNKAETSNYAFSASSSNKGIVDVPDKRLFDIAELVKPKKLTPATVEIVDIPGLAKGASEGEGIGNKFLDDIQQMDALIHVVRCFDDENLPHVEGSVNPVRDLEIVDLELQIKDIEMVERKIQRTEKLIKVGEKDAKKVMEILIKYKNHFENFQNARTIDVSDNERKLLGDLYLLTEKPVVYVCNVEDASASGGNKYVEQVRVALDGQNAEILVIAGALEADITELDTEEERLEFLEDAGLKEPGVNKMIRAAYDLLNLQAFFTEGPKEVRAWTIKKGMTARQSAGVIHSDLERGFIRAEVIKYTDFMHYKTEQAVKEAGKMKLEGKDYIVQDGDLMFIRFNV